MGGSNAVKGEVTKKKLFTSNSVAELPPNQGNQGNLDTIRENQGKNIDLMKSGKIREFFNFVVVNVFKCFIIINMLLFPITKYYFF